MQYFHAVKHQNLGKHGSLRGAVQRARYLPYKFTVKEQDEETGLYYYGARYLDAKYSQWLSEDSAVGEYIPMAPVNDEAKKHNEELPGQGSVFNVVNFQLYHYAGNNPVKYTNPDGKKTRSKDVQRQIDALGTKPNTPITDTVILKFQL